MVRRCPFAVRGSAAERPPGGLWPVSGQLFACITALAALLGSMARGVAHAEQLPELPQAFATLTEPGWQLEGATLIAYEDHRLFTCVVANGVPKQSSVEKGGAGSNRLTRRFLLVKPSTAIVDDLIQSEGRDTRQTHVLHSFPSSAAKSVSNTELVRSDGILALTVQADGHICRLNLPPVNVGAGEIAIENSDGQVLLAKRPLPSGVLPFGPEGTRLLERWDSAYQGQGRAPWDIGRPSADLVKAIEEGTIKPCRTVELGCGSGTNAIYLAQQGFQVTGIDIAPTALTRAREKADRAGLQVQWLLADVTAPPALEPFDFVFDRGCYHGIRGQNAAGYVSAIRRLTRPGASVVIRAGNP